MPIHPIARWLCLTVVLMLVTTRAGGKEQAAESSASPDGGLTLVVMDPLAAPLACDCVQGYAQRKYEALGEYLSGELGRPVHVVWGGAIDVALQDPAGTPDLVIGKHSVVLADARKLGLELEPVASLIGTDGLTTQTGLIVVRRDDRAQELKDLAGYRILFGPGECEEKSAAPMELLREHGIEIPETVETCKSCSEAAVHLMELEADVDAAVVISSYAQPLLEGCQTIQKGDLRVIGETRPVPFITAFANRNLDPALISRIRTALAGFGNDRERCQMLESRGFQPIQSLEQTETASGKK